MATTSPAFDSMSPRWEPRSDPEDQAGQQSQLHSTPLEEGELPDCNPASPEAPMQSIPQSDIDMVQECYSQASAIGEGLGEQIQLMLAMKSRIFFMMRYLGEIKKTLQDKKAAEASIDTLASDTPEPLTSDSSGVNTGSTPPHHNSLRHSQRHGLAPRTYLHQLKRAPDYFEPPYMLSHR